MSWSVQTRKRAASILGYVCISIFFSLTTYIIYVFYSTIVPSVIENERYGTLVFHFIFGNLLAINIYFNYIMAWLSSPGLAKDYQNLATQYPICRKCSMNKPPRTHHCSWCDQCILKFDHHCPWLNNCVGYYNHRYFFQFCCYMTTGCIYAGTFGFREYQIGLVGKQLFFYKDSLFRPFDILDELGIPGFITYYIFIAALTIAVLLIGLILWHGRMIGHGVTSLERVLNQDYTRQCHEQGYVFVNPYDFGWMENWKRFLGVQTIGQFVGRVLWPSRHKPEGDGITWDGYNVNRNLQSHRQTSRMPPFPSKLPRAYPNSQYRPVVPPWERQARPVYSSSGYQPKATESSKDL